MCRGGVGGRRWLLVHGYLTCLLCLEHCSAIVKLLFKMCPAGKAAGKAAACAATSAFLSGKEGKSRSRDRAPTGTATTLKTAPLSYTGVILHTTQPPAHQGGAEGAAGLAAPPARFPTGRVNNRV